MKIRFLTTLFLVFISCKNVTEKEIEKVENKIDSTELKIEKAKNQLENLKLNSFLESPIDLQEFKNIKSKVFTTGVTNGMTYYLHPEIKDSIFYKYNYLNQWRPNLTAEIIVFKNGENKHTYEDETEILIELRVFGKDSDLGKANLVGLSKTELESEFGNDYLTFDNGIVYSNKNKVLILELNKSKVNSFRYVKLNTEKIDNDLIGQIIK